MPILLKDMKVGMHDKVAEQVVDSFIRHSEVLELLPFDNAVSPSGGSTLTYGYVQTKLPSNTAFRALNTEYASSEAKLEQKAVNLKVFGGAFEIDRVVKDAEGMYDNMAYQIDEKVISAIGTFHNAMINGDSATNSETFDGLDPVMRNLVKNLIFDDICERQATAVITSHSLRELEDTCDQLALLHKGGIVFESDIQNLRTTRFKIQIAFAGEGDYGPERFEGLDIVRFTKHGSVVNMIVKGDRDETVEKLRAMSPAILDVLPLTLEEVFTYEMEALGYSFQLD